MSRREARPAGPQGRAGEGSQRRLRFRWRAPIVVAAARLAASPRRALLVATGVAAAVAVLIAVLAGSLATEDRTLQRTLAELPSAQRAYRIDSFGLPAGESYAQTAAQARAALRIVTPGHPYAVTSFTSLIVGGELVRLAAIDALPHVARLLSGRWPRECTPARCEVVQVGNRGAPLLSQPGIRLVRVGIAVLPERSVFGGSLTTGSTVAQPQHAVLLLADGAGSFTRLPALASFYSVSSWIVPLDPSSLHIWQVDGLLRGESIAQSRLAASDSFQLSGPDAALGTAEQDGHVAAQRIALVGGEISALVLGFAFVAAVGLRRGVANEARRLGSRGARRGQVWLAVVTELAGMTVVGAVAGAVVGVAAAFALADLAGLPGEPLVEHALATPEVVLGVAGLWLAASFVIVAVAGAGETRRRGVRLGDVVALAAAAIAFVGYAATNTNPAALSTSSGSRLFLGLVPPLVCLSAALLAGRLLGPAMRRLERAARRMPLAFRLAALALARAPARTSATAGFLIVGVGLALFASSYRATLQAGAQDEANYAVPLDYTLSEGSQLVLPLQAAPLATYDRIAPGVHAYPVLRRTATVAGTGTAVDAPTVLGVPAAAVSRLHWRSDYSSSSLATLAARLGAQGAATLEGAAIPPGARALRLRVAVSGVPVQFDLIAVARSGEVVMLDLGERPAGRSLLELRLRPGSLRSVVALQVEQQALDAFGSTHRAAEGGTPIVPRGATLLGPLEAVAPSGDPVVTDWSGWLPRDGAAVASGPRARLSYSFTIGQPILLRHRQATDGQPLDVVVSPNIASAAPPGGAITLNFQDAQLSAQIVGVATRFPDSQDLGQGFVVADESRLATALSADAPGTASPDELWISAPAGSLTQAGTTLAHRFPELMLGSRKALEQQLASDPLARGITLTLLAASALALALAAVGFWVAVDSDARDERGELYDLEAQGVPPATLRSQLRLRSYLLLTFGIVGGLALGAVLSRLVVTLVGVSAETTVPDPPLAYHAGWTLVLTGFLVLAAVGAALTELTARHALAGDTPARASWSLA